MIQSNPIERCFQHAIFMLHRLSNEWFVFVVGSVLCRPCDTDTKVYMTGMP